ncbi:MAG: hypothetical protein IKS41_06380 [Alphaproteobacteria bacterium]|nr:hypothetical protein [Alphaproteobacteria bacterium]
MKQSRLFFSTDSNRLFLPWMSMLMGFIAVLILAAGMSAYDSITNWQRVVSGSLTVQIPTYTEAGDPRGEVVNREIETALTILRSSTGVKGATVLSDSQMTELMIPWLGEGAAVSELPLPKLIDVMVDSDHYPDMAQLKTDLAAQVPSAVLDSHRLRLEPLLRLSSGGIKLIGFILILLALTASFTVIYATRTSLTAHEHIISLIHMMGANDWFITRQYAARNFNLTFMGSFFGLLLALPIMAGVSFLIHGATLDFIWNPALDIKQWIVLGCVPVGLALLAFVTTLKTVSDYLKRFL